MVSASALESFGVASKSLTTTVLPQADLQIGAVVSPARPVAGDFAVYTLFYTNTGLVGVPDIAITVTLPNDAVFVPGSSTPWGESASNQITVSGISIGPNSNSFVTYTIYLSPEKQIGLPLTTTAVIASANQTANVGSFDPNNDNNIFTQTTSVDRVSDLQVALDASPAVIAGQSITYAVVFTNAGPSDADYVTVTVSAPLLVPSQVVSSTSLAVGMTGTVGNPHHDGGRRLLHAHARLDCGHHLGQHRQLPAEQHQRLHERRDRLGRP